MNREHTPWDWPPPRRPRWRVGSGYVLLHDADDAVPQRRSWWGSPAGSKVAHGIFRAGVGVASAAIIIALTAVMISAGWLFVVVLKTL